MATPYALAGVTHVLRELLLSADPGDADQLLGAQGWQVSVTAPDLVERKPADPPLLNLFLYQVQPNAGWRAYDQRTHDAGGNRVASPPLAIDLRYLLTAYGSAEYQAEVLLGHAMLALHDQPVLGRELIRGSFDKTDPKQALMLASGLDEQVEALRITPEALPPDALERLWAGLQLAWRPSVSYLVTVLLLASRTQARPAAPVKRRAIATVPLARPVIESVALRDDPLGPVEPGAVIAIDGSGLVAEAMQLLIGAADLTAAIDRAAPGYPDRLTVTLPSPLPAGLHAGVQAVEIRHGVTFPGEAAARPLIGSNIATLLMRPKLTGAAILGDGVALSFAHEIGETQRVDIVLEKSGSPGFSLTVPAGNWDVPPPHPVARADLHQVWLPLDIPAGTYAVRAIVDGVAEVPREPADAIEVAVP